MKKQIAKERLIAAGVELMLARGFNSTSVDDICERADVSKGSFYHFFDSKEALGIAVLQEYYRDGMELLTTGEYASLEDPSARLYGFLAHVESVAIEHWKHGCLLGAFALELAETSPRIREAAGALFREIEESLALLFVPAAEAAMDVAPRALARFFLMALEGGIVMSRAYSDPSCITEGLQYFRQYLDALRAPAKI